jgi:hypothetical protein
MAAAILTGREYAGCGNSELSGCADTVRRTRNDALDFGGSFPHGACKKIDSTKVGPRPGPSAQEGEENRTPRPSRIARERDAGAAQTWSPRRLRSRGIGTRQNGFPRDRAARSHEQWFDPVQQT